MKHLFLLALLWMGVSLYAQDADSIFSPKLTGEIYNTEPKYLGDLFFNNHWTESTILLTSGEKVYGEKMKYNGYLDEVVWYNNTNFTPFILDKDYISEFWTTDSLHVPVHFKRLLVSDSTGRRPKDIYVQVALEGATSLYIQRRVITLPDEVVSGAFGLYAKKSYGQAPIYYIKMPSGQFLSLRRISRKGFLNLFPEQKETLVQLIRRNGIKLKTEQALIQVIRLMNPY